MKGITNTKKKKPKPAKSGLKYNEIEDLFLNRNSKRVIIKK